MRTLSDDLTVAVSTQDMNEGYVRTTIYHKGIGVFSGQSYIPGDDSSLYVNLNDVASQNRGKIDYLKLNDNNELTTMPLVSGTYGSITYQSRFVAGQINNFSVTIDDGTTIHNTNEDILTGYDYPNKDIRTNIIENDYDSCVGRIMQGCNWGWGSEDISNPWFQNKLLPHIPYGKFTKKFGIGLQLFSDYNTDYYIRTKTGNQMKLGYVSSKSNQTFITLADLYYSGMGLGYGTTIYLKQTSDDDAFGTLITYDTKYKRRERLDSVTVYEVRNGGTRTRTFQIYDTLFAQYLQRYVDEMEFDWDVDAINSGDNVLFDSGWKSSITAAELAGDNFKDDCPEVSVPLTSIEEMGGYTYVSVLPNFTDLDSTWASHQEYEGNCPIAVYDDCTARYYLAWNDRYGDIQSQPFDGKIVYSEDIKSEEIVDYKSRRRVSHKSIQPKWKINTKWLNEEVYPFYESIFTSPYLLLYDTEQDRAWNVIVADSKYEEKTRNNEKSLFNLELNVEAIKTQELTY